MKFFLILFFLPAIVFAQNLRVVDGDTIHIGKIKYRFHGIDAPEMSQICKQNNKSIKCGVLSKVKLVEKINNQKVNCKKIILGCTELPIAIFAFKSFKKAKKSKIFIDPNLILANTCVNKYKAA